MRRTTERAFAVEVGSGNVFADLGLPDAELRLAKAHLANLITHVIAQRGLTQSEAAAVMQLAQPDVSNLTRGRLKNFSQERIAACLNHLNFDIRIQVAEGPRWKAKAGVTVELVPTPRRARR